MSTNIYKAETITDINGNKQVMVKVQVKNKTIKIYYFKPEEFEDAIDIDSRMQDENDYDRAR